MKRPPLLQPAKALAVLASVLPVWAVVAWTAGAAAAPVSDAEACLEPGPAAAQHLGLCERALAEPGLPAASRATLLVRRGELWLQLGQSSHALADFSAAIAANPASASARERRALLLQRRGDLDAAVADLSEAITLNPHAPDLRALRAMQHHQAGRPDAAGRDLAAALALAPDHALAHLLRGTLAYRRGAHGEAAEAFARSLSGSPVPYPLAAYWLALATGRAGGDAAGALAPYAWWWDDAAWSRALVAAIEGRATLSELEASVAAIGDPALRAQASFFAAEWARLNGDMAAAQRLLEIAAVDGAEYSLEAIEARGRLTAGMN